MILRHSMTILLVAVITACASTDNNKDTVNGNLIAIHESQKLKRLVEDYFDEFVELNPGVALYIGDNRHNNRFENDLSEHYASKSRLLHMKYLNAAKTIDRSILRYEDQLTHDLFIQQRQQALRDITFPSHLLPLNQFYNRANLFARLGSGQSLQPFNTVEDYQAFLQKMDGFVIWTNSVIERMREGIRNDIILPKAIVDKLLPQFTSHIVRDHTKSLFWQPIEQIPAHFSEQDKQLLSEQYTYAIQYKIIPAYRRLHRFIASEYLPRSRASIGLSALPGGENWYQYLINYHTGTELTADEIHQVGLEEVANLLDQMAEIQKQVGYEGSLKNFFYYLKTNSDFYFKSPEEVVVAYQNIKQKINPQLTKLFLRAPSYDYVIKPVEKFRAASAAGASYVGPSTDGSRPGVFYINTYNLKAQPKYGVETLSLHEASPGHHYQKSAQMELRWLPRFRRFSNNTAYSEGWALYAETLGKDMNLFTDPYQYYGHLNDSMLRAMRLVVDTGIHTKNWTREQAIAYMLENSTLAETDVVAEVERYIANPGQALAYKIGQRKILALRESAEDALGDDFDIREFHDQVLGSGALPLSLLESKIERWISIKLDS